MITAILLVASIVIAVIGICKYKNKKENIELAESYKWARMWNEKWDCDNNCKYCTEKQFCILKDEVAAEVE